MAGALNGLPNCNGCFPRLCDGTTQDCTLDSYYANPANGPRPSASGGTAQNPSLTCTECGVLCGHAWTCSQWKGLPTAWPGFQYPATAYDDYSPPTERLPTPAPDTRPRICPCGIDRRDCDYHR